MSSKDSSVVSCANKISSDEELGAIDMSSLDESDLIKIEKLHAYCSYIMGEFRLDETNVFTKAKGHTFDASNDFGKLNDLLDKCIRKQEEIQGYLQFRLSRC